VRPTQTYAPPDVVRSRRKKMTRLAMKKRYATGMKVLRG